MLGRGHISYKVSYRIVKPLAVKKFWQKLTIAKLMKKSLAYGASPEKNFIVYERT